jgi:hypothetical protein
MVLKNGEVYKVYKDRTNAIIMQQKLSQKDDNQYDIIAYDLTRMIISSVCIAYIGDEIHDVYPSIFHAEADCEAFKGNENFKIVTYNVEDKLNQKLRA